MIFSREYTHTYEGKTTIRVRIPKGYAPCDYSEMENLVELENQSTGERFWAYITKLFWDKPINKGAYLGIADINPGNTSNTIIHTYRVVDFDTKKFKNYYYLYAILEPTGNSRPSIKSDIPYNQHHHDLAGMPDKDVDKKTGGK